jgi:hypothetical protein
MVKTMKHAEDVELSSEELMQAMNEGDPTSTEGATLRFRAPLGDVDWSEGTSPLTPHGEREAERAAVQAMEEIRQANETATQPNIRAMLDSRAKTHGDYSHHATVTQMLKQIMHSAPNWADLKYHERETLEMVAHKVGRILCGDPHHHDHWRDIAGYATLSADRNR